MKVGASGCRWSQGGAVISGYQLLSVFISGYQWVSVAKVVEYIRSTASISDAFIEKMS